MKPLCIDLFCGLGGWSEGFLAEGWNVVGYDIERHVYPERVFEPSSENGQKHYSGKNANGTTLMNRAMEEIHGFHKADLSGGWCFYPGVLVLQSVLDLHGSMFRNASCIVASPPCQEFSYMAMPWRRGKQIAAALRGAGEFPEPYTGSRTIPDLTRLFDACFRIQREACEAAGRHIPMVVENVRGAIPWVGRSQAEYGSFFLWGDVRQVGNRIYGVRSLDEPLYAPMVRGLKRNPDGTGHAQGSWFAIADSKNRGAKVPNFRFDGSGGSFQTAAVNGIKSKGSWFGDYQAQKEQRNEAIKNGGDWFSAGLGCGLQRHFSSRSDARKAASAQIAKIPFALASHIARVYKPCP